MHHLIRAGAIAFVDHKNIGDLEQARLQGLHAVTCLRY